MNTKMQWVFSFFLAFLPVFILAQETGTISVGGRIPREERAVNNFDLGVNTVPIVHARFPGLTGEGLAVSVKELRMDSSDIDFRGRHLPSSISSSLISTHATTMASIIAGAGNSFYTGKGVAWNAGLSSSSFFNLMPDDPAYFQAFGLTVQNHSYGLEIENFYGAEAEAYDRQVYDYPEMIHVFSAGNAGEETSEEGPYAGLEGFANLTGTMKMAKNVLTVGAVDSFFQVESRSSRGPAYDGRLKPELVAFGQDGSSGAAAITSGTALLLQQAYRDRHDGQLPPAALLRAVLLNSADDLGTPGPDFIHGYGNLDARGAVQTITEDRFYLDSVGQEETATFQVVVPDNTVNLNITLAWSDPPAAVDASAALINDLDLSLSYPASGQRWHPWVLSSAPSLDSLVLPARQGIDRLNNQEQITLESPAAGIFTVAVSGYRLPQGVQHFVVAYEWTLADQFEWLFPTRLDNMRPEEMLPLRWESTLRAGAGTIEYSLIGSDEWVVIAEQVNLSQPYLLWAAPDTLALAQVRLTAGDQVFLSDTFTISRPLELSVDVNCEDQLLLSWGRQEDAAGYTIFSLVSDRMEPVLTLADTFAMLKKSEFPSDYFAVAAGITPAQQGLRSRTLNLDFQNAGCYIRSFFASLQEDLGEVELTLTLGSIFGVENVFFEKRQGEDFIQLASLPVNGSLEYQLVDRSLDNANNYYRTGVKLMNGDIIYSEVISVYYLKDFAFVLYPNPAPAGQDIVILSKEANGAFLFLYDAMGRLVLKYDLLSKFETIPTRNLMAGIYFYQIRREGEKLGAGKIMIGGHE